VKQREELLLEFRGQINQEIPADQDMRSSIP
jgi:hypothetical protein